MQLKKKKSFSYIKFLKLKACISIYSTTCELMSKQLNVFLSFRCRSFAPIAKAEGVNCKLKCIKGILEYFSSLDRKKKICISRLYSEFYPGNLNKSIEMNEFWQNVKVFKKSYFYKTLYL